MASLTEAMEAAAFPTVVEVGAHVYFMCGTSRIGALQCFRSFVLVPVRDALAGTSLRISVKLADWHDGAGVLEERGQSLCFRNARHRRKDALARGVVIRCWHVVYDANSRRRFQHNRLWGDGRRCRE